MAHANLGGKDIFAGSPIEPRKTGSTAITNAIATKNNLAAWRLTSHSSVYQFQNPKGPQRL